MTGTSPDLGAMARRYASDGVVMVEYALSAGALGALDRLFVDASPRRLDLSDRREVAMLGSHPTFTTLARAFVGAEARLVRAVLFDKSPEANWFVPWHQDRTVALADRGEVPGFGNWTVKDGTVHAEPPIEVLQQTVTLRAHLDDCEADHGPLEVALGTHRRGRLDRQEVVAAVATATTRLCLAVRGDILAMSPLLLHRSQRARVPKRRRVLHLEFAAARLPAGLDWAIEGTLASEHLQ